MGIPQEGKRGGVCPNGGGLAGEVPEADEGLKARIGAQRVEGGPYLQQNKPTVMLLIDSSDQRMAPSLSPRLIWPSATRAGRCNTRAACHAMAALRHE